MVGRPAASTLITARSVSRSTATIVAPTMRPRRLRIDRPGAPPVDANGSSTSSRVAFSTTCALVTMYPVASTMTPDPLLRSIAGSPVPPSSCSSGGAYPVTKICTTEGLTFAASSSSDRENSASAGDDPDRGGAAAWACGNAAAVSGIDRAANAQITAFIRIGDFLTRISHLHTDSGTEAGDHNADDPETRYWETFEPASAHACASFAGRSG